MNKRTIGYILTLAVWVIASAQFAYSHPTKRSAKAASSRTKAVKIQSKTGAMTWREAAKLVKRG